MRNREHMPCLDGLRGLAAVIVVLGHAAQFGLDPIILHDAASYGVLIFFVLSGFLMGELYLPRKFSLYSVKEYLASRVARIVPIYYIVIIVSFFVYNFLDTDFVYDISLYRLIRLLTFNGSTSVFWSIGPEFQFYFLFVPLWLLYDRVNRKIWFVLFLLISSGLCMATIRHWPGILVFSKLHIFACGLLCAVIRLKIVGQPPLALVYVAHTACFTILILIMSSSGFSESLGKTHNDQVIDPAFTLFYGSLSRTIVAGIVVVSFSYASPLGLAILGNPLACLLGRCSFSIYLLHNVVYDIIRESHVLEGIRPQVETLIILCVVITISAASYYGIEGPSRRWLRSVLLRLPFFRPVMIVGSST